MMLEFPEGKIRKIKWLAMKGMNKIINMADKRDSMEKSSQMS